MINNFCSASNPAQEPTDWKEELLRTLNRGFSRMKFVPLGSYMIFDKFAYAALTQGDKTRRDVFCIVTAHPIRGQATCITHRETNSATAI